jgi:hypothetical protein
MHVHRERAVAQKVIVQRRDLDTGGGKFCHDRIDLVLRQHEVAHHHTLSVRLFEREPPAERKAGFERDAIERGFQIGARQADTVDTARHRGAGFPERISDLRLPVVISGKSGC